MQDHIRYDILAQDALRGVIRKVLSEVAATGSLPGEHHFFITFLTNAPGVRISAQLREKYAEQMTIVVQHQFWDMKVTESYFEITLSFSDKAEKLHVPFAAIRGFYDPSVNFELEFDAAIADNEDVAPAEIAEIVPEDATSGETNNNTAGKTTSTPKIRKADDTDGAEQEVAISEADGDDKSGAQVVSLDAFRKKS